MSKYLLECNCGNKLPVEIGDAGRQITCSCGNLVDVPTLRKLRHLPPAETQGARPAASTWSARKGVITACLLLAGALAIVNGWSWYTQPKVPVFDAAFYENQVIAYRLAKMTPAQSWRWWVEYYKPMAERGFPFLENADRGKIESIIAERESLRQTLWVVAALAAAIAAAAAFWPKASEVTSRRID